MLNLTPILTVAADSALLGVSAVELQLVFRRVQFGLGVPQGRQIGAASFGVPARISQRAYYRVVGSGVPEVVVVAPRSVEADLVIELSKRHQSTLGALAFEGFHQAAERGWLLAMFRDEQLAGYVLFRVRRRPSPAAMLTQLCVADEARGTGVARVLVEEIESRYPSVPGIGAWCRSDFPAHHMWPRLGFAPTATKRGRSQLGLPLTHWWRPVADLKLFDFDPSVGLAGVVMDTNIFRDWFEPRLEHVQSTALLASSWAAEFVEFLATPQLNIELANAHDLSESVRRQVSQFQTVSPSVKQTAPLLKQLKSIGAYGPGDAKHLAEAAAGGAKFFVTRDNQILDAAEEISDAVELRVRSPADLLLELDESEHPDVYQPKSLHETPLTIRRLSAIPSKAELARLATEGSTGLQAGLSNVAASVAGRIESVQTDAGMVALSASHLVGNQLVAWVRTAKGEQSFSLARQLAHMQRAHAVELDARTVVLEGPFREDQQLAFAAEGFVGDAARMHADCREGILDENEIRALQPWPPGTFTGAQFAFEVERRFWPATHISGETPTYVVPIRPPWADKLLGNSAQPELSDRPLTLGLAREHVYYCAYTGAMKTPARLLWYVSGGGLNGGLRAWSWLLEAHRDRPRTLYRKFEKRGIYDRSQVEQLAKKPGQRVLALIFGRTEMLPSPYPLKEIVSFDKRFGNIQTIRALDEQTFATLIGGGPK